MEVSQVEMSVCEPVMGRLGSQVRRASFYRSEVRHRSLLALFIPDFSMTIPLGCRSAHSNYFCRLSPIGC